MITHVIWDWNGTLLDDADYATGVVNEVLKKYGKPTLRDTDEYRKFFCFPVLKYYEAIGLGGALYDEAAVEWCAGYAHNEKSCPLRAGIPEVLEALRKMNVTQAVVSASPENLLQKQVTERGIAPYFVRMMGLDNIHARSKAHIAKAYIDGAGVRPENVLFIGDTLHDDEVARAAGCRAVLLKGGHQLAQMLKDAGCTVLDDAGALPGYIGAQ